MSKFNVGDQVFVTFRADASKRVREDFKKNTPYTITGVAFSGMYNVMGEEKTRYLYEEELSSVLPEPSSDVLKLLELYNALHSEDDDCVIIGALEMLGWDIEPTGWKLKRIIETKENEDV